MNVTIQYEIIPLKNYNEMSQLRIYLANNTIQDILDKQPTVCV